MTFTQKPVWMKSQDIMWLEQRGLWRQGSRKNSGKRLADLECQGDQSVYGEHGKA